jgi:hypothetical protein
MFSGVPAGSLANAGSVGAKTVNFPLPFQRFDCESPKLFKASAEVANCPAKTLRRRCPSEIFYTSALRVFAETNIAENKNDLLLFNKIFCFRIENI